MMSRLAGKSSSFQLYFFPGQSANPIVGSCCSKDKNTLFLRISRSHRTKQAFRMKAPRTETKQMPVRSTCCVRFFEKTPSRCPSQSRLTPFSRMADARILDGVYAGGSRCATAPGRFAPTPHPQSLQRPGRRPTRTVSACHPLRLLARRYRKVSELV